MAPPKDYNGGIEVGALSDALEKLTGVTQHIAMLITRLVLEESEGTQVGVAGNSPTAAERALLTKYEQARSNATDKLRMLGKESDDFVQSLGDVDAAVERLRKATSRLAKRP